jgi:hypothetical protein
MASGVTRLLGRADLEWILLSVWVSLLGVQLPVEIRNLRLSPADIVLAGLMVALLVRRPRDVARELMPRTPVHLAILALVVALAWGSAVSLARTGVLVQEALLNKDVGVLVLGSIVVASRLVVRHLRDVRQLLRTFLIAGAAVTWVAFVFRFLMPILTGVPFGERFDGFLLNPSANAVFLSVLLMVQIGFVIEQSRARWQVVSAFGITMLLVLTLSRSTWLALMIALVAVAVVLASRSRRWLPAAIAAVLLIFSAQPLLSVLTPVVAQIVGGQLGRFERQIAPSVTPSPDIGQLLGSAPPSAPVATGTVAAASTPASTQPVTVGATPVGVPSASPSVVPTAAGTRTPEPVVATASVAERYVSDAQSAANDRFGATDRVAFNVIAVKLWLSSVTTALAGLGLGVFLQVSPQLFGTAVIIHNTYLWLPVEMGVPGIIAIVAVLYAMTWTIWRLARGRLDDVVRIGIAGSLLVFLIWIGENEGLYQRTLWTLLALGSIAIRPPATAVQRLEG